MDTSIIHQRSNQPSMQANKLPVKQSTMEPGMHYTEAFLRVGIHSQKRTLTHIGYRSTYHGMDINRETELVGTRALEHPMVLPGYLDSNNLYTLDTPEIMGASGSAYLSLDETIQQVGSRLKVLEGQLKKEKDRVVSRGGTDISMRDDERINGFESKDRNSFESHFVDGGEPRIFEDNHSLAKLGSKLRRLKMERVGSLSGSIESFRSRRSKSDSGSYMNTQKPLKNIADSQNENTAKLKGTKCKCGYNKVKSKRERNRTIVEMPSHPRYSEQSNISHSDKQTNKHISNEQGLESKVQESDQVAHHDSASRKCSQNNESFTSMQQKHFSGQAWQWNIGVGGAQRGAPRLEENFSTPTQHSSRRNLDSKSKSMDLSLVQQLPSQTDKCPNNNYEVDRPLISKVSKSYDDLGRAFISHENKLDSRHPIPLKDQGRKSELGDSSSGLGSLPADRYLRCGGKSSSELGVLSRHLDGDADADVLGHETGAQVASGRRLFRGLKEDEDYGNFHGLELGGFESGASRVCEEGSQILESRKDKDELIFESESGDLAREEVFVGVQCDNKDMGNYPGGGVGGEVGGRQRATGDKEDGQPKKEESEKRNIFSLGAVSPKSRKEAKIKKDIESSEKSIQPEKTDALKIESLQSDNQIDEQNDNDDESMTQKSDLIRQDAIDISEHSLSKESSMGVLPDKDDNKALSDEDHLQPHTNPVTSQAHTASTNVSKVATKEAINRSLANLSSHDNIDATKSDTDVEKDNKSIVLHSPALFDLKVAQSNGYDSDSVLYVKKLNGGMESEDGEELYSESDGEACVEMFMNKKGIAGTMEGFNSAPDIHSHRRNNVRVKSCKFHDSDDSFARFDDDSSIGFNDSLQNGYKKSVTHRNGYTESQDDASDESENESESAGESVGYNDFLDSHSEDLDPRDAFFANPYITSSDIESSEQEDMDGNGVIRNGFVCDRDSDDIDDKLQREVKIYRDSIKSSEDDSDDNQIPGTSVTNGGSKYSVHRKREYISSKGLSTICEIFSDPDLDKREKAKELSINGTDPALSENSLHQQSEVKDQLNVKVNGDGENLADSGYYGSNLSCSQSLSPGSTRHKDMNGINGDSTSISDNEKDMAFIQNDHVLNGPQVQRPFNRATKCIRTPFAAYKPLSENSEEECEEYEVYDDDSSELETETDVSSVASSSDLNHSYRNLSSSSLPYPHFREMDTDGNSDIVSIKSPVLDAFFMAKSSSWTNIHRASLTAKNLHQLFSLSDSELLDPKGAEQRLLEVYESAILGNDDEDDTEDETSSSSSSSSSSEDEVEQHHPRTINLISRRRKAHSTSSSLSSIKFLRTRKSDLIDFSSNPHIYVTPPGSQLIIAQHRKASLPTPRQHSAEDVVFHVLNKQQSRQAAAECTMLGAAASSSDASLPSPLELSREDIMRGYFLTAEDRISYAENMLRKKEHFRKTRDCYRPDCQIRLEWCADKANTRQINVVNDRTGAELAVTMATRADGLTNGSRFQIETFYHALTFRIEIHTLYDLEGFSHLVPWA